MQLILFDDRRNLTQAVRNGHKTNTRRILKNQTGKLAWFAKYTRKGSDLIYVKVGFDNGISEDCRYKIGEVVAVGESYATIENHLVEIGVRPDDNHKGWTNKLHVRADLMPLRIKILDIRPERLQNISDQDCIKEGIMYCDADRHYFDSGDDGFYFKHPRTAFAALIDKVSRRGTWEKNPYVWRIEFEIVGCDQ